MKQLFNILNTPLSFRRVAFIGAGAMLCVVLAILWKHATDLNEHAGAVMLAMVGHCFAIGLYYFRTRGKA